MSRFKRIVILTGAGISAESGIATFRDKDGIWAKVDVMDVATPQGFARNPQLVLDFYNKRRKDSRNAKPNAAHLALARLESEHADRARGEVLLVNHFSWEQGVRGWVERRMAPFADQLGWRPVFDMRRLLGCDRLELVEERSLRPLGLFTMLRLRRCME